MKFTLFFKKIENLTIFDFSKNCIFSFYEFEQKLMKSKKDNFCLNKWKNVQMLIFFIQKRWISLKFNHFQIFFSLFLSCEFDFAGRQACCKSPQNLSTFILYREKSQKKWNNQKNICFWMKKHGGFSLVRCSRWMGHFVIFFAPPAFCWFSMFFIDFNYYFWFRLRMPQSIPLVRVTRMSLIRLPRRSPLHGTWSKKGILSLLWHIFLVGMCENIVFA